MLGLIVCLLLQQPAYNSQLLKQNYERLPNKDGDAFCTDKWQVCMESDVKFAGSKSRSAECDDEIYVKYACARSQNDVKPPSRYDYSHYETPSSEELRTGLKGGSKEVVIFERVSSRNVSRRRKEEVYVKEVIYSLEVDSFTNNTTNATDLNLNGNRSRVFNLEDEIVEMKPAEQMIHTIKNVFRHVQAARKIN